MEWLHSLLEGGCPQGQGDATARFLFLSNRRRLYRDLASRLYVVGTCTPAGKILVAGVGILVDGSPTDIDLFDGSHQVGHTKVHLGFGHSVVSI